MINHIFYHSVDLDGKCSGAIAYRAVKPLAGDIKMHPINYGDEFPWAEVKPEDTVYMLDFSLQPSALMKRLEESCTRLVWIDHHISAIEEVMPLLTSKVEGFQDSEFAACELAWMFFYDTEVPWHITLLGNYDIWKHDDLRVIPFQYGMRTFRNEPTVIVDELEILNPLWETVIQSQKAFLIECMSRGDVVLSYIKSESKVAKQLCFEAVMKLNGVPYSAILMNKPFVGSKGFDGLYDEGKHDLMVTFHMIASGRWTVSLYTTHDDLDVSKICSSYGGGGHAMAAGFQIDGKKLMAMLGQ